MEPVQVILLTKVKEWQGRKKGLQNQLFTMYESGWGRMKRNDSLLLEWYFYTQNIAQPIKPWINTRYPGGFRAIIHSVTLLAIPA
jgi:hypothetical protein